jgi:hypothetical protein
MGGWDQNGSWEIRWGRYGVDSIFSGYGMVASCCEFGDEPSGSGATELVSDLFRNWFCKFLNAFHMLEPTGKSVNIVYKKTSVLDFHHKNVQHLS